MTCPFFPKKRNSSIVQTIELISIVLFITALFLFSPKPSFAAFLFEIDSIEPTSVSSKSQEVEVLLDITDLPSESFFRVAWQEEENKPYFGYIKINGSWVKIKSFSEDCSEYYHVSDTSTNSVTLITKIGEEEELTSGTYLLRAHRFTSTCKSHKPSENIFEINVDLPTPIPTPTSILTPTSTPTPPASTSTPTPTSSPTPSTTPTPTTSTDYPSGIILTEFMPDPDTDEQEWVEIKNTGSSEAILTNWQIDDIADGGGSPRDFSATISSGGYHKIEISGWLFNNAGDSVRLLKPDDTLVDETSYSYSNDGVSWVKVDDNWCEAESSTPGEANSSCRASSASTPTPTSNPASTLTPTLTPSISASASADLDDELEEELATMSSIGSIAGEVTESAKFLSHIATSSSRLGKVLGGGLLALGGLGILGSSLLPLIKKKIGQISSPQG